jgi:hypothetical protein
LNFSEIPFMHGIHTEPIQMTAALGINSSIDEILGITVKAEDHISGY